MLTLAERERRAIEGGPYIPREGDTCQAFGTDCVCRHQVYRNGEWITLSEHPLVPVDEVPDEKAT